MEILRRLWNEKALTEARIVIKNSFMVLAGLIVLCIGVAAVVLAGASKPYGRPGKLPEPINQYQVYKEKEIGSLKQSEWGLELYYKAPEGARVEYVVKDSADNVLASGTASPEGGEGKITLVLKKPEPGKSYSIKFVSTCKLLDGEKSVGSWNSSYLVTCD